MGLPDVGFGNPKRCHIHYGLTSDYLIGLTYATRRRDDSPNVKSQAMQRASMLNEW